MKNIIKVQPNVVLLLTMVVGGGWGVKCRFADRMGVVAKSKLLKSSRIYRHIEGFTVDSFLR